MNSNTNLCISRHLALITHDAAMSVNSSILRRGHFENEIFSILSSAHAWTSVILEENRDSHRHSTTSFAVVAETCYEMLEVGSIFAVGRVLITFVVKKVQFLDFNTTETEMFKFKGLSFGYRWTFYQLDDTFSSAFEAKVSNISILGAKSGAARNCTACPPGYHSTPDNTDCKICPNGTSSSAGSHKCTPCQGQTFAAQVYSFTFATRVSEGSVTHTLSFCGYSF